MLKHKYTTVQRNHWPSNYFKYLLLIIKEGSNQQEMPFQFHLTLNWKTMFLL